MFKRILMWGTALLLLGNYASAQNFFISGGNKFSAVICGGGSVFTWGLNDVGQLGRVSGTTSIPGQVKLPVNIKAIDAGSGAHVIALACDGTVWTWGEGTLGQLGNGGTASSITPVQVKAGATDPANPNGFLKDIVYVTSGTSQSYAITKSGNLIAWGANAHGELGNNSFGTTVTSSVPVYVVDSKGNRLKNVIAVDAGDNHCYALVDDDNDGDPATGRVYGWGGHDYNAVVSSFERNALGKPYTGGGGCGAGPCTDKTVFAPYAVLIGDSDLPTAKPLTGINMITAGDAFGFFTEKSTGHVYSVGANNLGQRGLGFKDNEPYYATLVLAGEMEAITGDKYLSNVVSISGGQTHGMAVVKYNGSSYAVTWGGNQAYVSGLTTTDVLAQPNLTTKDYAVLPGIVRFKNKTMLKDAKAVSDSDFNSYVVSEDATGKQTIYIWGHNGFGQVGQGDLSTMTEDDLGTNVTYSEPQVFNLPPCTLSFACPVANLGTDTMFVCPGSRFAATLYAGSSEKYTTYEWKYKNTKGVVKDVTASANTAKGKAYLPIGRLLGLGTYYVKIKDARPVEYQGCGPCPDVIDSIVIAELKAPFDTVYPKFCGINGTFKVNIAKGANVNNFEFFSTETGTVSLGKLNDANVRADLAAGKIEIDVANLKTNAFDKLAADFAADPTAYPTLTTATAADSIYSIWIEDKSAFPGTLATEFASKYLTGQSLGNSNIASQAQLLQVFKNITLKSAILPVKDWYSSTSGQLVVKPVIYEGTTNSNSALIANYTKILWEGKPQSFTLPSNTALEAKVEFIDKVTGLPLTLSGDPLKGTTYWIGLVIVSSGNINIYKIDVKSDFNYPSSLGAGVVSLIGASEGNNSSITVKNQAGTAVGGLFHSYQFEKTTDYICGRKEISIHKECPPCSGIESASLVASVSKDTLCAGSGEKATINFTAKPLTTATPNNITYEWSYWDGKTALPTALAQTGTLGKTPTAFVESMVGYYIVKLYDATEPKNSMCFFQDTVRIDTATTPKYTFGAGQTLCKGDAFKTIDLNLTGFGPWNVTLDGTPLTLGTTGATTYKHTITPTGAKIYSLTTIKDKYCTGTVAGGSTAEVKVNPLPTSTFTNPTAVCTDAADVNVASLFTYTGVTGVNSAKTTFSGTGAYLSASGVFSVPDVTAQTKYPLYVNYEDLNGCKYGDTAEIVVNPIPVVTFDLKDKYCSEETINYAAAASLTGGVFSVNPVVPLSNGTVAASALGHKTNYTFSYLFTDANGCDTTVSDITYGVKVPDIVSVKDSSVSGVKEGTIVKADIGVKRSDAAAVINWLDETASHSPMTSAQYQDKETITVTQTAAKDPSSFTYQAFQTLEGCEGKKVNVTLSISPCSALMPIVSDKYFCADETDRQISASLDPTRGTDQIGWIDGALGAAAFTNITSYTDNKVTGSPSYKIADNLKAGEYKYFVAAWEESNKCWSSAKEVTFIVKANPEASIASQANAACFYYSDSLEVTVSPFYNALGISSTFKVDDVTQTVPKYMPSKVGSGNTMKLTYEVTALVTPAGYIPSKSCASNLATAVYNVERIDAPTFVTNQLKLPIDKFPYKSLELNVQNPTYTYKWYEDAAVTPIAGQTTKMYDPSKGVDYSDENKYPGDKSFKVQATQVTANGCESEKTTGILDLIRCPHPAPVVSGNGGKCKDVYDIASTLPTFTASTSASSPIFTWTDENGTAIGSASASFKPVVTTVGKHTVYVQYSANNPLTSLSCPSPKTTVEYEVFPMPVPTISDVVANMCIYDDAKTLSGLNDGGGLHPDGKWMFNISNASSVEAKSYSFYPLTMGAGTHTISFTYTTEHSCTAISPDYTITVHEVPVPKIDANIFDVPQIDDILDPPYNGTFKFTGTADAGKTLQWFTTKPLTISTASSINVGSEYIYTLSPQPVNLQDHFDSYDYTVYVNQKITAPITCYSEPIDVKITVTDCPVPKPTVVNDIACDYWTGAKIPALIGTRGTNWGTTIPDNNTSLYKRVNGSEILSVDGKHVFADISDVSKVYVVEYQTRSTTYGCSSQWVSAKLDVKSIGKPTILKGAFSTCFDDITDRTFEVATVAGQKATWYTSGDSTSAKLGTEPKLLVNPKDGSKTVYVSMKLTAAPYCESNPALASATLTVNPVVVPPTVEDNLTTCATSFDIDPNTRKAKFPSATNEYILTADYGSADDVVWKLSDNKTALDYATGSIISVPENDPQIGLIPGAESELYAFSVKKYGALSCYSNSDTAVIKPKPTPKKPAKIVDGAVSNEAVTFICQGSDEDAPVYRAQKSYDGTISWFNEVGFALNDPISIADTLDLEPYLNTSGEIKFIANETFNGCISDTTIFIFEVAPRPQLSFGEQDTLYYCADFKGSRPLIVTVTNVNEGDTFKYDWVYSDADGDKKELEATADANIKTWYYTTPGLDEATVVVTNETTKCKESDTLRLVVAEKITPSFSYDVYSGPQEIVFRNQATNTFIANAVWNADSVESETYSTRYNWTFVYNADQSVRKMVQKDSTRTDRGNSLYYVGRGPSDYDSVIVFARDSIGDDGKTYKLYKSAEDENGKGVRVTSFNGKTVQVHGGIPFEYGVSTVTLTRSLFTMDGIPYDTRSCNMTSPEVEVFMPITTGLFIPTSFAPGHSSPLVSVFKPYGAKIVEFNIWVYDNWGNTVFYSNKVDENGQPTEAWDGRDKVGNPMPADVYYWKVDATFEDGTKWEGNPTENGKLKPMGSVFLLR